MIVCCSCNCLREHRLWKKTRNLVHENRVKVVKQGFWSPKSCKVDKGGTYKDVRGGLRERCKATWVFENG